MNILRRNFVPLVSFSTGFVGGNIIGYYHWRSIQRTMINDQGSEDYHLAAQNAATQGDMETIEFLSELYPYIKKSVFVAREAAKAGYIDIVKKIKLDSLDMMECSQYARFGGHLDIVKYLELYSNEDTNSEEYLERAMGSAVFVGHFDIVKYYERRIISNNYRLNWNFNIEKEKKYS